MEKRFVWAIRKKNWLFLPVAFLLAVMPVVIRATQHFLSGDLYRLFLTGQKTELFSQYRARFLWIMAAVMLILVLVFWKKLFSGIDRHQTVVYIQQRNKAVCKFAVHIVDARCFRAFRHSSNKG